MHGPNTPGAPAPAWRYLIPAGIVELACLSALGWVPHAAEGWSRPLLFAVAFAAYAVAALEVKDTRGGATLVWVTAILLRLALLPLAPTLSHDVYRYLWDGQVQLGGVNPFGIAPMDPDLTAMRTAWFTLVPHADAATVYPPLAQMAFLALALAGGTVLQAKLLWVGLDLGTGWMLGRIAHLSGRSRRLTQLLYLWSPLLVVEVAWNGHMVSLALFLLALIALLARAPVSAGITTGLAAMVVPPAAAGVPPLMRRFGLRFLGASVVGALVAYLPYAAGGWSVLEGLGGPLLRQRFLEGPFLLLESAIPGVFAPRVAASAIVLGVAVWVAARGFRPERALLWVLGAALLLSPALRPCYALWILPFAALRVSLPWLFLTGVAFLAYTGWAPGVDVLDTAQPVWVHLAVWLPLLFLLWAEARKVALEELPPPLSPARDGAPESSRA